MKKVLTRLGSYLPEGAYNFVLLIYGYFKKTTYHGYISDFPREHKHTLLDKPYHVKAFDTERYYKESRQSIKSLNKTALAQDPKSAFNTGALEGDKEASKEQRSFVNLYDTRYLRHLTLATGFYNFHANAADKALLQFQDMRLETLHLLDEQPRRSFHYQCDDLGPALIPVYIKNNLNPLKIAIGGGGGKPSLLGQDGIDRTCALSASTPKGRPPLASTSHPSKTTAKDIASKTTQDIKKDALLSTSITKEARIDTTTKFSDKEIDDICEGTNSPSAYELDAPLLATHRFLYLRCDSDIKIEQDEDFLVGVPLYLKGVKTRYKLVMMIFLDSLPTGLPLARLMPNTMRFFRHEPLSHHFANGDSTVPSVPTFINSLYPLHHRINSQNPVDFYNNMDAFSDYFTSLISAGPTHSPTCGYSNGFDRVVSYLNHPLSYLLTDALENLRTLSERSHFCFLSLFDTHNTLASMPDLSISAAHTLDILDTCHKSTTFNPRSMRLQANTIAYTDFYLGLLYDYIERNYHDDEVCIALISDHGKPFISRYPHWLSDARMRVPLFIRNAEFHRRFNFEAAYRGERISSNVDIFPTIAELCEVESPLNDGASLLSKVPREFALSESIFEGQTYKARLSFKDFTYMYESKNEVSYKDARFTPDIDTLGHDYLLDASEAPLVDEARRAAIREELFSKHLLY